MDEQRYISFELEDILVGDPLPVDVYVYIDFRFITFRAAGDQLDRQTFDRLHFKKVRYLFVQEQDCEAMESWSKSRERELAALNPDPPPEVVNLNQIKSETRRKMMDIFQEDHPDKHVSQVIEASRKIVDEIMKFPLTVRPLSQLQGYSEGTVDHSVNVSVLSTYLAIQMGYAHNVILQHVALGALLHDVGKVKVPTSEGDDPIEIERRMQEHPTFGLELFEGAKLPNEVKMIIAQHHEHNDGTGFPKGLRGNAIYDLAKIVSIANLFDELVAAGKGPLVQRQREAIRRLDEVEFKKFDPQKLEKAIKVLKMGV